MVTKKKAPAKKLTVKKETVKDLSVQKGKSGAVKGGGGRTKPSQPQTPSDLGCTPCS